MKNLGCQPLEREEQEGVIDFMYQGQHFVAVTHNQTILVDLYYFDWHVSSLDDIDNLARLRKVINEVNQLQAVTSYYDIREDVNIMAVCSKREVLFLDDIPNVLDYLHFIFRSFFDARMHVETELAKQNKSAEEDVN